LLGREVEHLDVTGAGAGDPKRAQQRVDLTHRRALLRAKQLDDAAGAVDDSSSNDECGAGPMQFARIAALTLNYQDGKFVGWFVGDEDGAAAFATASGIGIGTPRAKAAESVTIVPQTDSTLGEEFSMGAGDAVIGGIFAGPGDTSPIESLFAGTNCFFR
jgi:hypothetical protein